MFPIMWTKKMTKANKNNTLLPSGLSDLLPPNAAFESLILESLIKFFYQNGYEKVKPPLIEFEDSLLNGLGTTMSKETFRLMDPVSQRMMGMRADMTPQIARISATRLKNSPRPLRLSYSGQVLRVKGSKLRSERQFSQVGAELIGVDNPLADAEIIVMAANSLKNIGIKDLSIDIGMPTLIPRICKELNISKILENHLRVILDSKDIMGITSLKESLGDQAVNIFSKLLASAGPSPKSLKALNSPEMAEFAINERKALCKVIKLINEAAPSLKLTIDPVENRGFEYHTGVTFTFFSDNAPGELGAGGRYITNDNAAGGEDSTGFTLFLDIILRSLSSPSPQSKIFIPIGTKKNVSDVLHKKGHITIAGLAKVDDNLEEAKRLGCTHLYVNGNIKSL